MNEVVPEAYNEVAITAPILDEEILSKMRVAEFQTALEALRLFKHGLKAVLIDWLKAAMASGAIGWGGGGAAIEVENTAGTDYHPSVYWKDISPKGEEIYQSKMDIDGTV